MNDGNNAVRKSTAHRRSLLNVDIVHHFVFEIKLYNSLTQPRLE